MWLARSFIHLFVCIISLQNAILLIGLHDVAVAHHSVSATELPELERYPFLNRSERIQRIEKLIFLVS
jgi:hypothetical protein